MAREQRGSRRTPLVRRPVIDDRGVVLDTGRAPTAAEMSNPARCTRCGHVYDLGHVTVTGKFADCDVWQCPGCGTTADSRRAWSGAPGAHMGYTDLRELAAKTIDEAWG